MAIELTEFADVSISVSPVGVQGGNFGILGFLTKSSDSATNAINPAERARAYTGLTSVGGDWAATTEVYKAATAFYSQTPEPTDFVVLMSYDTDQPASIVGGTHDTLAEIVALGSTAAFIITNETDTYTLSLDVTGAGSLADVANIVDTGITAQGIAISYGTYGFNVVTDAAGISKTLSFASGVLSDAMGLSQHQAKVSNGIAAETPVASLAAALTLGVDFVGLDVHKDMRDVAYNSGSPALDSTLEIAQWAEAAKKIFCNTSNSLSVLNPVITSDTASVLKAATLRFSLTTFSRNAGLYPSSAVFGRAASVNFDAINSTLTLNLKQLAGVIAEDLTPAEYQVLKSKNASAVIRIGKSVNAYTDSRMASGSWLDTTHGLLWLENRCETDLFNLMYQSPTKVPGTQAGINTAKGVLEGSLQAAVRNGLCAPGYLADGTYLPEGYVINAVDLADVPSGDKSNRIYKGLSFKMVGAGAFHDLVVSGTFAD